jgi:uncharacterized integral membrane protein
MVNHTKNIDKNESGRKYFLKMQVMLSVWFCCVLFSFLLLQKKNSKYIFFEFGFYTFSFPWIILLAFGLK